jgi:hypothetical protein
MASEPIETPTTNLVSRLFDSTQALASSAARMGPFRASLSDHCVLQCCPLPVTVHTTVLTISNRDYILFLWRPAYAINSLLNNPVLSLSVSEFWVLLHLEVVVLVVLSTHRADIKTPHHVLAIRFRNRQRL